MIYFAGNRKWGVGPGGMGDIGRLRRRFGNLRTGESGNDE